MTYFLIGLLVVIIIIIFAKKPRKTTEANSDSNIIHKGIINEMKIDTTNNTVVPYHNSIPPFRKNLLYTSNKNPDDINVRIGFTVSFRIGIKNDKVTIESLKDSENDEPSTIFYKLPIIPKEVDNIEKLGYYPSYAGMNPYQRYKYINWLIAPEKEIDIGYVFVYYYGLERQLMTGNFEESFNEILFLRKHHNNRSFMNYSNIALTHACLVKRKFDYIENLVKSIDIKFIDSVVILMLYYSKIPINSVYIYGLIDDIISITNTSKFRNYYKNNPETLFKNLNIVMSDRYPNGDWHFYNDFNLSEIDKTQHSAFANYSFPDDLRKVEFPDFLTNSKFIDIIFNIISDSHELTKNELKELRKKKS